MTLMNVSQKGIDLIKKHEGCKLFAYRCPAGVVTIGYGHTKGVKMGMAITQKQADSFLIENRIKTNKALSRIRCKSYRGK